MILAAFNHDKESKAICLRVNGHAGQAERGKDIICASASILAYTLAQYLHYVHNQGGLVKKPHIVMNDGDALIVAKPTEKYEGEVLNAFFVAEVGYSLLERNYPQYVKLKLFGESQD